MPEMTKELLARLEAWGKEIGAPVPSQLNPEFGYHDSPESCRFLNVISASRT